MRGERLVIRRYRPARRFLGTLVALGLVALGGYGAYEYGRDTMRARYVDMRAERDRLQAGNQQLRSESAELRRRLAMFERTGQVEREAYVQLRNSVRELQERLARVREELAFYRGIVSSGSDGLAIQSFELEREGDTGAYLYELVLTGAMKNDTVISGTVELSVAGEREGRAVQLTLAELSERKSPDISFQLKHFRQIRGRLVLPQNFVPREVLVQVSAAGEEPASVEKRFEWPLPPGRTEEAGHVGKAS